MKSLLGRRGDPEPTTCAICGRLATGIGVSPQYGKPIAWLCTSPECIEIGTKVYPMHTKELSRIETMAVAAAGETISSDLLECILGALWDAGVRSLDQLDAKTLEAVRSKVHAAPEYGRALGTGLNAYGDAVKKLIDTNEAPF